VAIYLDANVLWSWRTFDEADRLALSIVAHQLGQKIFIPGIAAREAEETHRRNVAKSLDSYEAAVDQLHRWFDVDFHAELEPQLDIAGAVDIWRYRLGLLAEVIPTDDADAAEALEREIVGRAPTKQRVPGKAGSGARDAAIWLTVLRHHRNAGEAGIFVSKNSQDFASGGELKAALAAELSGYEHPLSLYLSLDQLIASLGEPTDAPTLEIDELRRVAEPLLLEALKHRPDVASAYWVEFLPQLRYGTHVRSAQPVRICAQRRYERGDEAVTLIDADWNLSVEPRWQDIDTDAPAEWSASDPFDMTGRIQLFLPERDDARQPPQLITGRWSSPTTLWMSDSGTIWTSTQDWRAS
jgi:hypothetical protein